jgi:hypothetical protein
VAASKAIKGKPNFAVEQTDFFSHEVSDPFYSELCGKFDGLGQKKQFYRCAPTNRDPVLFFDKRTLSSPGTKLLLGKNKAPGTFLPFRLEAIRSCCGAQRGRREKDFQVRALTDSLPNPASVALTNPILKALHHDRDGLHLFCSEDAGKYTACTESCLWDLCRDNWSWRACNPAPDNQLSPSSPV